VSQECEKAEVRGTADRQAQLKCETAASVSRFEGLHPPLSHLVRDLILWSDGTPGADELVLNHSAFASLPPRRRPVDRVAAF